MYVIDIHQSGIVSFVAHVAWVARCHGLPWVGCGGIPLCSLMVFHTRVVYRYSMLHVYLECADIAISFEQY